MSSIKKSAKENIKPVKYTKVEENSKKTDVGELLQNATVGETPKIENPKFKVGEDDSTIENLPNWGGKPKNPNEKRTVREVNNFNDLIGAIGDIEYNFENVTDEDYYPEDYIEKKMASNIPDSLGLEEKEVPDIDEDKVRADVEKEQTKKKNEETENLTKTTESKIDEINENIDSLKKNAKSSEDEINKIYDNYKVNVENDAIKRGLARSSVAILKLDGVESGRAEKLSGMAETLSNNINNLESEIIKLQKNLDVSLSNLDLELSDKINSEIEAKIKKLKEEQNKAIEFNNNIKKLEAEYQLKRGDKRDEINKLEEELRKTYEGKAQEDKNNQILNVAMDFFNKMSRKDAINMIATRPDLAQIMGDSYYDLYYYIMRKR